jgi:hypothetical protein
MDRRERAWAVAPTAHDLPATSRTDNALIVVVVVLLRRWQTATERSTTRRRPARASTRRQPTMSALSSRRQTDPELPTDDHRAEGQALVEYSLILLLVVIACIAILQTLNATIMNNYWRLVQAMP